MTAWADRDQKRLWIVGGKLGDEPPVQHGILGGSHITTATPRFVADTPKTNAEWLFISVLRTLGRQGYCPCGGVAVRHPIMELPRRTGSHVCCEIRLGAAQPAQVHELVNTELVGLGVVHAFRHARLPIVIGPGAFRRFSDPIPPVIAVCKTAARPAIVRDPNALHVADELLANSADILDFRIPSYPDPVINDSAEMLDELPVQMRADFRTRILGSDLNIRVRSEGRAHPSHGSCGYISAGSKKAAAIHPVRVNPNQLLRCGTATCRRRVASTDRMSIVNAAPR